MNLTPLAKSKQESDYVDEFGRIRGSFLHFLRCNRNWRGFSGHGIYDGSLKFDESETGPTYTRIEIAGRSLTSNKIIGIGSILISLVGDQAVIDAGFDPSSAIADLIDNGYLRLSSHIFCADLSTRRYYRKTRITRCLWRGRKMRPRNIAEMNIIRCSKIFNKNQSRRCGSLLRITEDIQKDPVIQKELRDYEFIRDITRKAVFCNIIDNFCESIGIDDGSQNYSDRLALYDSDIDHGYINCHIKLEIPLQEMGESIRGGEETLRDLEIEPGTYYPGVLPEETRLDEIRYQNYLKIRPQIEDEIDRLCMDFVWGEPYPRLTNAKVASLVSRKTGQAIYKNAVAKRFTALSLHSGFTEIDPISKIVIPETDIMPYRREGRRPGKIS